jgi:hypothetical protein
MSAFRNPVGPQPSGVYWRRRLVVGLGLLAVIVIVILIVSRLNSSGSPAPHTPSPSSSATPNPSGTSAAAVACDPSKVTVEATTDANSYGAGVQPVLSFTLKSLMSVPCTISAGSDVQEFIITSGSEQIWDSKDCQSSPVAATAVLTPGVPKQGPNISWDRTRSSTSTCNTARDQVTAGGASYHLGVKVGTLTSTTTKQFLLD